MNLFLLDFCLILLKTTVTDSWLNLASQSTVLETLPTVCLSVRLIAEMSQSQTRNTCSLSCFGHSSPVFLSVAVWCGPKRSWGKFTRLRDSQILSVGHGIKSLCLRALSILAGPHDSMRPCRPSPKHSLLQQTMSGAYPGDDMFVAMLWCMEFVIWSAYCW